MLEQEPIGISRAPFFCESCKSHGARRIEVQALDSVQHQGATIVSGKQSISHCVAVIALGFVPCCASQTDDQGSSSGGESGATTALGDVGSGLGIGGGLPLQLGSAIGGSGGVFAGDTGIGLQLLESSTGGAPSQAADPTLEGQVTQLTPAQVDQITATACNAWAIEPESSPAKLQLVVDVSGSMDNAAPGTDLTKWEVTRDALVEAICGTVGTGLPENIAVGLMFYPNKFNDKVSKTAVSQSACLNLDGITPMDVLGSNDAGTHRNLLRTALTTVELGSGTPTADAYEYALNKIVLAPEQAAYPGDPYVLLITDGMPTLQHGCFNSAGSLRNLPGDEVVALVEQAYGKSVKTFVIGSPGSEEGRPWLSKAASLGGTAQAGCDPDSESGPYCHMDMTTAPDFSKALREGLDQVVRAVSSCKYDVPTESADGTKQVDPNAISPIINYSNGTSELIGRDNANGENCTEGFRLLPGNTQMELCRDTCARLDSDTKATMQLLFGCAPDQVRDILL